MRLCLAVRRWALWLPVLARNDDLALLLARTTPGRGVPFAVFSIDTIAHCCHKAVRQPMLMVDRPCLREGLLLNRFLFLAGYTPTLHFGIDRKSVTTARIAAHCWVKLGDKVFNPPEPDVVEIFAHRSRPCGTATGAETANATVPGTSHIG